MSPDSKEKPVILYYVSPGELLAHGKNALAKIAENIEIFAAQRDAVSVHWHHDTRLDDYLKAKKPELFEAYIGITEDFSNSCCGVYEADSDIPGDIFESCRAYYGSGGYYATCCLDAGKPVMIWDISGKSSLCVNE